MSLATITVVQLIGLVVALARLEGRPSAGASFVGFVITVVWLLTIHWVVMGAWRRTVWGCPFEHSGEAATVRLCPRHRLVGLLDDHPERPERQDPTT